ncbi:MAG: hypothetical protein ISR69_06140 [Gammaproteobacteria bacterium]|nr:hypothetical protein [Gammaproteobacteria bacterium]
MRQIGLFLILSLFFTIVKADSYWSPLASTAARSANQAQHFLLNIDQLRVALGQLDYQASIKISLPRANGYLNEFEVTKTSVLAADLASKYPEFKTYKVTAIDHTGTFGRMELINDILSVVIKSEDGQELLKINDKNQQQYSVKARSAVSGQQFSCGANMASSNEGERAMAMRFPDDSQYRAPLNQLRKLRVAIATTTEYSAYFGTTKAEVLAELTKALNRINGIYESDLGITLELVSSNENVIFLDSDSFSNSNASVLIDESQEQLDLLIGNSNYDLGHTFSTGAGGLVASVGTVCSSASKAKGVTGSLNPTDDEFWVDYVAHEIGHQLGAEHTFNGTSASCGGGTRNASTAYEPGSGSTIMSYAGICGSENLQPHSDATFHSASIDVINATVPSNCGELITYSDIHTGVSNVANPAVTAGADKTIPTNTPFMLTATGTAGDSDTLYYQWDSKSLGSATTAATIGTDLSSNPLFRSNLPQTNHTRYFPSLVTLLANASGSAGETLPTANRILDFSVKVVDGKGGYVTDDVRLTATTSASQFSVTSQNSSGIQLTSNTPITINWNIGNTNNAPVNCSSVEVQLLSFSSDQSTFCSSTIATGEANDGTASISLPDISAAVSRFLVKCESNVFFAINSHDFEIINGSSVAENDCFATKGGVQIDTKTIYNTGLSADSSDGSSTFSGGGALPVSLIMLFIGFLLARTRR